MMKTTILFFFLLICSVTCIAQQSAANNPDPRVYYKNGALHIEPASCVIVGYHVSLLRKYSSGDLVGPFFYSHGRSSADAINLPLTAKPGDTIFFEEILAQGADNRIRSMNPIKIIVK